MTTKTYLMILFMVLLISRLAFAHDSDKAFFTIHQEKERVVIEAEFPWTIRNSLIENAPHLNNLSSQKDFDDAFFELIKQNLKVYSPADEVLPLVSVTEMDSEIHSHSYKYKLVFKGNSTSKIENTLLFNIFENSQNYHYFITDKDTLAFETTKSNAKYSFSNTSENRTTTPIVLGLILSLLLLIIGLKRANLSK